MCALIAVDIDSTLYDFETPAREAFLRLADESRRAYVRRGAYDPWTQWRSPADSCGIDVWLEAVRMVHDSETIRTRQPFDGARSTLWALVDEGHRLTYLSDRASETYEATRRWLVDNDFPLENSNAELIVVNGSKGAHLTEYQYLIDDRPQTALDFIYDAAWKHDMQADCAYMWETGDGVPFEFSQKALEGDYEGAMRDFVAWHANASKRRAYMLMYPYNVNLTDCHGLYLAPTWAGLNPYMVKHGLLSESAYTALAA